MWSNITFNSSQGDAAVHCGASGAGYVEFRPFPSASCHDGAAGGGRTWLWAAADRFCRRLPLLQLLCCTWSSALRQNPVITRIAVRVIPLFGSSRHHAAGHMSERRPRPGPSVWARDSAQLTLTRLTLPRSFFLCSREVFFSFLRLPTSLFYYCCVFLQIPLLPLLFKLSSFLLVLYFLPIRFLNVTAQSSLYLHQYSAVTSRPAPSRLHISPQPLVPPLFGSLYASLSVPHHNKKRDWDGRIEGREREHKMTPPTLGVNMVCNHSLWVNSVPLRLYPCDHS